MQVELVKHEHYACEKHGQCRAEPPRLPRCRLNLEADNPLRAIPFAIAIAGKKAKMVGARAQIGVNSFASSAGFTPLTVEALQKISETNPLRYGKAESGICECDSFVSRRNTDRIDWSDRHPICHHGLNVSNGRGPTGCQVRGIDYRKPTLNGNPDPSLRVTDYRPASIDSFAAGQPIGRTIFANVPRSSLAR